MPRPKKIKECLPIVQKPNIDTIPQDTIANVDPQTLILKAIEKGVSIDILERLLAMRERLQKDEAEKAFREAMSAFQSKCPVIIKSAGVNYVGRKGTPVKYQYAPLDVIVSKVNGLLADEGLSYTFTTAQIDGSVTAICHAHHILGHSESTSFSIPIDLDSHMQPAQQVAAALTYAKRYAFCNAFGILTGDEDNDANKPPKPPTPKQKEQEETKIKAQEEAKAKLDALPDYIKDAFNILGWKHGAQWNYCEMYKWDYEKIKIAVNAIVDKQNGK